MDAYEALRTIQTLAHVALESEEEGLSAEALPELQRRTLNGIVVVTEKALAKVPSAQNRAVHEKTRGSGSERSPVTARRVHTSYKTGYPGNRSAAPTAK
jgi:hypothetical protein